MVRDQSAVVSISPGGSDTHAGLGHKMEEIKFTTEELSRRYSNKCLWWSRRTGFERTLVVISIFLFVACMVLVLVNILIEVKIRNQAKTAPKICNTEECIHAASRILERIDPTSDPCNDFYQFACGSYAEKHTVPDDYFIRSLMQTMQDDLMVKVKKLLEVPVESEDGEGITKAKMLYSSCMNTSSVEDESIVQLQELLSEAGVGEWPSLTPGWNKTDLGLEWRLARLNFHQVEPFFHSYISRDDKNSSNFLLHLHSDTSVLSPDYYLNATEENQAYIQLYRELITETLRLLDADSKQAAEDVEDMIAFETAFAELAKLSYSQMAFMNESLDDYLNFDRKTLSDLEEILPDIKELIVAVKLAFSQLIKSQSWLDNETTERCKKQLKGMREKIAYPSYILDPDQLSHDYKGLEIKPGDFLDNVLRMNRYEMKKELEKMTRTVDKEKDWYVQPLMVNAFYQSSGNDVIFPVGILRPPLFVPGRPQYLNYGSLGIVIGHELAHSFDTSGRKLDLSGNSTQWWSEDVKEILQEKVACFVDQYSKFPLKEVDQNVDGNHTLQENICDHSAVQQAYLAYLNYVAKHGQEAGLPGVKYTNQQIFFIQFAQVWCEVLNKDGYIKYTTDGHSPGQYRTNGALQNSQFFAEAFSCTLGSPMNPENKCGLWG
ncbi:neprilysin-1-like isoform X4 [Tachypleus tridentatus]|uniref:neprilysin-1-like isoform X4 n=1 Tax=Tachypleus tridentatus TaxID=6853 RepID=UPI003FD6A0FE